MSLDDLIAERLRFFELVDLDESQLELLCQRRETLDACKYYNSGHFKSKIVLLQGMAN